MIEAAKENDRILSIGHQRHYSLLYAHALEVMHTGVLGDVQHIRALWHRNNTWPSDRPRRQAGRRRRRHADLPRQLEARHPQGRRRNALEGDVHKYGYKSMEELVRWRLFNRTGGGLMAELGSHQLDACSIFLGKVHPLAVSGVGGKYLLPATTARSTTTSSSPSSSPARTTSKGRAPRARTRTTWWS